MNFCGFPALWQAKQRWRHRRARPPRRRQGRAREPQGAEADIAAAEDTSLGSRLPRPAHGAGAGIGVAAAGELAVELGQLGPMSVESLAS